MRKLNPSHVKAVLEVINQGPYFNLLSMPIKEIGMGHSLIELTIGRKHLNPFGALHGGVYASAIDTAAYWSVYGECEEGVGLITIDLKVDFLAPASTGVMTVKGRRIRRGKTMCLAEATAFDEKGKWLAHGTSKLLVLRDRDTQTMAEAFAAAGVGDLPPKFIEGRP